MAIVDEDRLTARVFKIESLNTHNGPGYRTVIYFKGCPLNCQWCHNPEGISSKNEIWIINKTCIGCESCIQVCPNDALSMTKTGVKVNREKCVGCYKCAEICPTKSIEKLGEDISVKSLVERVLDDKLFMETSGGGVTITGGEPGEYPNFVEAFFRKCKENEIHTAFDTSGFVSKGALQKILPFTDLIFFDLKIMDNNKAEKLTGSSTRHIFDSLKFVKDYIQKNGGPELQFRTPVIPGSTDDYKNLSSIAEILANDFQGLFTKWELCMFNDICEDKYLKMNKKWNYKGKKYSTSDFEKIRRILKSYPEHNIEFSGFVSNQ